MTCYDEDVINTYNTIVAHWVERDDKEKPTPHPMFTHAKFKIKNGDPMWFMKSARNKYSIGNICKDLVDCLQFLS